MHTLHPHNQVLTTTCAAGASCPTRTTARFPCQQTSGPSSTSASARGTRAPSSRPPGAWWCPRAVRCWTYFNDYEMGQFGASCPGCTDVPSDLGAASRYQIPDSYIQGLRRQRLPLLRHQGFDRRARLLGRRQLLRPAGRPARARRCAGGGRRPAPHVRDPSGARRESGALLGRQFKLSSKPPGWAAGRRHHGGRDAKLRRRHVGQPDLLGRLPYARPAGGPRFHL